MSYSTFVNISYGIPHTFINISQQSTFLKQQLLEKLIEKLLIWFIRAEVSFGYYQSKPRSIWVRCQFEWNTNILFDWNIANDDLNENATISFGQLWFEETENIMCNRAYGTISMKCSSYITTHFFQCSSSIYPRRYAKAPLAIGEWMTNIFVHVTECAKDKQTN